MPKGGREGKHLHRRAAAAPRPRGIGDVHHLAAHSQLLVRRGGCIVAHLHAFRLRLKRAAEPTEVRLLLDMPRGKTGAT